MKVANTVGVLSIIAGIIMIVAGAATWFMVSSQLADEKITVPADSTAFAGAQVRGPLTAYFQAETINKHAIAGSEGTYAELGAMAREAKESGDEERAAALNEQRTTMMNASFLRASLFTSVVAFGLAALVMGLGLLFILMGLALTSLKPAVAPAPYDNMRESNLRDERR